MNVRAAVHVDPSDFGRMVGMIVREAVTPLKARLDEMEQITRGVAVTKSLDAEALDALAELSERIDQLEASVSQACERGFRYRGYWREGMEAKKTDAFTHNGSLFLAICDTRETPDSGSDDWRVVARKGRDGKDLR